MPIAKVKHLLSSQTAQLGSRTAEDQRIAKNQQNHSIPWKFQMKIIYNCLMRLTESHTDNISLTTTNAVIGNLNQTDQINPYHLNPLIVGAGEGVSPNGRTVRIEKLNGPLGLAKTSLAFALTWS